MEQHSTQYRQRRRIWYVAIAILIVYIIFALIYSYWPDFNKYDHAKNFDLSAQNLLEHLPVKPLDSSKKYDRKKFGHGWQPWGKCNTRQRILQRDLTDKTLDGCHVIAGKLYDLYTGNFMIIKNKAEMHKNVQIDHVVALANAWQTGAAELSPARRQELANDDLELLAVSSKSNLQKSSSDANQWLPTNIKFRCAYVARQIAVKIRYHLWVTAAEKATMKKIIGHCPMLAVPEH